MPKGGDRGSAAPFRVIIPLIILCPPDCPQLAINCYCVVRPRSDAKWAFGRGGSESLIDAVDGRRGAAVLVTSENLFVGGI